MSGWLRSILVVGILTAGCTEARQETETTGTTYMQQADARFHARFENCKKIHNYDPERPPQLGESDLAPTERAWQECVYDAVRKVLIPATSSPEIYESAIRSSQTLTNGIEKGTVTRSQRKEKMEQIIAEIEAQERSNAAVEAAGTMSDQGSTKTEFTRRMIYDLRGM